MTTRLNCDAVNGGYSGFYFIARKKTGRGLETIEMSVPLQLVLELAAAWHLCPSASAGHVCWHRDRNKRTACEPQSHAPIEDLRSIEKLESHLAAWGAKTERSLVLADLLTLLEECEQLDKDDQKFDHVDVADRAEDGVSIARRLVELAKAKLGYAPAATKPKTKKKA